jgi:hypothetical protein
VLGRIEDGTNTYSYVRSNPESYEDPTGLKRQGSGWECDGHNGYRFIIFDNNPCTRACTLAHEMSHVVTAQQKFGDVCRNKPAGYDPSYYRNWVNGWDATFQRASECQAYRVEDSCLEKKEGECACKDAAHARRYGSVGGIATFCH